MLLKMEKGNCYIWHNKFDFYFLSYQNCKRAFCSISMDSLFVYYVQCEFCLTFLLFFTVKGGECDSLNQVNSKLCTDCINKNRDAIVGVKVRLSASAANDGANEEEAFRFV